MLGRFTLLLDKTHIAALVPKDADPASITSEDFEFVNSWEEATTFVNSGDWRHVNGTHYGGKMTIYMSAGQAGYSKWLSGPASIRVGPPLKLTGHQNMIETIHHEYLHYSGVRSHVDAPVRWGIRVRDDLGGWLFEQ